MAKKVKKVFSLAKYLEDPFLNDYERAMNWPRRIDGMEAIKGDCDGCTVIDRWLIEVQK